MFEGYWERPDANAEAFRDGWFRTGDQDVSTKMATLQSLVERKS